MIIYDMGEIITFYSYKGGVGRTMALANVAVLLSKWGYKILIVDWDLEAPGLEYFLKDYLDWKTIEQREGVIDILTQRMENWQDLLIKIELPDSPVPLHFLTAGKRNEDYFSKVRSLDLQAFYADKGGLFIERLRDQWKEAYDYILIDSRTGITDFGGVCTIQLPDILLLLFTATEQSLSGVIDVANKANQARQKLPVDRLSLLSVPIPSRFETEVEFEISQKWLDRFASELSNIYANWLPTSVKRRDFLEITKIPYRPYFSFGEKLPVLEQGTLDPTGLGYAYETLSALLANKLESVEHLLENRSEFVRSAIKAIGTDKTPKLLQVGQTPRFTSSRLFQGRDDVLNKIKSSFYGGVQNERYFLDGIRRVGKTSILNHLPMYLPKNVIPVFINFDLQASGLRGPIDSAVVLRNFCEEIKAKSLASAGADLEIPDGTAFQSDPGKSFNDFLATFKLKLSDFTPLLMIDEFQDLLHAIARTGSGINQDTLVLDQLRGLMDQGRLYVICTGSIRFDSLSNIVQHRIFGSLTRLPISFLSEDSVGEVFRAGLEEWVKIPSETIESVYELTGGYPWLVQTYGSALVDLLNNEYRTVAAPADVMSITENIVLPNSQNFEFWWPSDELGIDEEQFIERLFREYPDTESVSIQDFFRDIRHPEKPSFMQAVQNLRACEVLDSTQPNTLKIRGSVLRQWLKTQMQADGRLKIRPPKVEKVIERGKIGMFIDHENLFKSLERVSTARGIEVPIGQAKVDWLSTILKRLLEEAKRRVGEPSYKITVAFWSRPTDAQLIPAYFTNGFTPQQPESIKIENAVDFKVADEVRRAQQQATLERSKLSQVIIVSGDSDYVHMVRNLVNEGVSVQIWGGSQAMNQTYAKIIGEDNVVIIDDICGL